MAPKTLLKFKISSALKDIIGRDLITDDFMAVFELVKNSYDAHATEVEIIFKNLKSSSPSIIIKDNGKGMDLDDLKNKWLFVAYSAKTEGTEDGDYRSKIYQNRPYAGAKGIGRFSCDRLGKKLTIQTGKNPDRTNVLYTDWEKFEKGIRDEFIDISVEYSWKAKNDYGLKHGTVLEIEGIRSIWDREKILKLKDSLGKLISPSKVKDAKSFRIRIRADEEIETDDKQNSYRKKVNGDVNNFIFEELGLKTTKIELSIPKSGKAIATRLTDGGTLIYKIQELNDFTLLHDINITIYYLNNSAKLTFAKRMGLASRLYGHIFLYKNGIRIYPFGEPNEDPLKIDERKSRKQFSRLGTSEIIGNIEISGNNKLLKETSSRGDGLINNPTYDQLKNCFTQLLERLEKYVVDVQEWGLSIEEDLDEYDEQKLKNKIGELITELTSASNIVNFEYSPNFLNIIKDVHEQSAAGLINNLKIIAKKTQNAELVSETNKVEKKLKKLKSIKEEAEKSAEKFKTELVEKESQNLFLKSIKSQDLEDVLNLMHHIGLSTSTIQNYLKGVVFRIDSGVDIPKFELKDILAKINIEVNKIYSISRFATKANFKVNIKPTKIDVQEFIREYLNNIVKPFMPSGMKLLVVVENSSPFFKEVRPLELTILIDNLINNSKKAKANKITIVIKKSGNNKLIVSFIDDGNGIKSELKNKIFEYGFTTTDGSGLGLKHVQDILEKMNSSISLNTDNRKETEFILTFNQF